MSKPENLVGALKSFIDIFFAVDGKFNSSKFLITSIVCLVIYYSFNRDDIHETIKTFNYDNSFIEFQKQHEIDLQKAYDAQLINEARQIYVNMKTDAIGMWVFEPPIFHDLRNLVFYSGTLPNSKTIEMYQNQPVAKLETEYQSHLIGMPYYTGMENGFMAKPENLDEVFIYTCPMFNRRNMYFGSVELHWDKVPHEFINDQENFLKRAFHKCTDSARKIGLLRP